MIEPWLKAIRDHPERPSSPQCWVLAMLAERLSWRTGEGFASTAQLMADTGESERTVRRATRWARDAGLLKEVRRGHRLGDGRCRASEWALIGADSQPAHGDLLRVVLNRSEEESQPATRDRPSLPVPPSRPVLADSPNPRGGPAQTAARGKPLARRADSFSDKEVITAIRQACCSIFSKGDADLIEDEQAIELWEAKTKPGQMITDAVRYFEKIFGDGFSIDTYLQAV